MSRRFRKHNRILGAARLAGAAFCLAEFVKWNNKAIETTEYEFCSTKVPEGFDGFCIAQVSDVQSQWFGRDQEDIISRVREMEPDIIVVTGDLVDRNHTDFICAVRTVERLMEIAQVYYVNGNHELSLPKESVNEMYRRMRGLGVKVIRNSFRICKRNGERIVIAGIAQESIWRAYRVAKRFVKRRPGDPWQKTFERIEARMGEELFGRTKKETFTAVRDNVLSKRLKMIWERKKGWPKAKEDDFVLMLSHCPQYLEAYSCVAPDLILAGHAHGGQIRLPGGRGVLSPGQGLFPKYTSGFYSFGKSTMLVSRGLGNSTFPLRLNNRPELVKIVLKRCKG